MDYLLEYNKKKNEIDLFLNTLIKSDNPLTDVLFEAMNYSLLAGGKRLRPVLLLSAYALFHNDYHTAMDFAVAIECIHTYSLIHDDLPCMDNDDYRRGILTNHKKYSEAIALLAGDALLNTAYEMMLQSNCCDANQKLHAIKLIAHGAGINGMIGGQMIDINSEGKTITVDVLEQLHAKKTGCLIVASLKAGGVLAGAKQQEIDALEEYGKLIGLTFQIKDDLLDVTGTMETLGKPVASDIKNNKSTYVSLYGIKRCEELLNEYRIEAKKCLEEQFGDKGHFLSYIADYIVDRKG